MNNNQLGTAVVNESGEVSGLFKNDQPIATQDNIRVTKSDAETLIKINETEESYLKTIHARYCIPRALGINITDISRYYPDKERDPNYYEYWYKINTSKEFFLMSRRLVKTGDNDYSLNILYNIKIAREGEND